MRDGRIRPEELEVFAKGIVLGYQISLDAITETIEAIRLSVVREDGTPASEAADAGVEAMRLAVLNLLNGIPMDRLGKEAQA